MPAWFIAFVALAYSAVLFSIAWRAERSKKNLSSRDQAIIYTLSLAVYCTSWTFFGAVGTAVSQGWTYLPIYLGPALVFVFARPMLERLANTVTRENLTSIADFISSRYGKSRVIAALVTLLALFGAIPYVALQLRALGASAGELVQGAPSPDAPISSFAVFAITVCLGAFAIIFGARRYEADGRNTGLVTALAFESLVKLIALVILGLFATTLFFGLEESARTSALERMEILFAPQALQADFITTTILSMAAIVCLPRQFYVGFVECRDQAHLRLAQKVLPAYMALTSIVVIPIALAGLAILPSYAKPDLFVVDLPLSQGADWLALLMFLGGFSAATGMVIAASVALSTMISNDLVGPFLLRAAGSGDVGARMLLVRRLSIVSILGLAFFYTESIDKSETLAATGLLAFAAVAQFAPALIGALYWPGGTRLGAGLGLSAGMALWVYTLFVPAYAGQDQLAAWGLTTAFGGMINPQALLGLAGPDNLTHGVMWSLGVNCFLFLIGSRLGPNQVADRLRAAVFAPRAAVGGVGAATTVGDLMALTERFVGRHAAENAFQSHARTRRPTFDPSAKLDRDSARAAERLIAKVIGAPSARVIVASALQRGSLDLADVVSLLDETSQELSFSRDLLSATLDNISQGVSVVDRDLRLVAWNRRYLEIFNFPAGFIQVGRPIADVIRFNALAGECGPGEVEAHVARRLGHMRRGSPHIYERVRPNGAVLKTIGNPMPGGGYVTSFTDITAEKQAQLALQEANERLEARVAERTAELARAKEAAVAATQGKTKFLAAASHDLLQPLNAARLFATALHDSTPPDDVERRHLVTSIDRSISSADRLLRALLDVSKLDAGGIEAAPVVFALDDLIFELANQVAPLAGAKGLALRRVRTGLYVNADRALLASVIQNFLSNAVRYTEHGAIVVGCRRAGNRVRVEVWDTGPGIAPDKQSLIFEEFKRLRPTKDGEGVGLGLAIVERAARIMQAAISLRSWPGRGSVFSVDAPRAEPLCPPAQAPLDTADFTGLRVLCVDNEAAILEGMALVLNTWGCAVTTAETAESALAVLRTQRFDIALVDHHLGEGLSGLDILSDIAIRKPSLHRALVTANADPALARQAGELGARTICKPYPPEELRAFLSRARLPAAAL